MRRLSVLSAVFMVLSFVSPLRAFAASCNGLSDVALYQCLGAADETTCFARNSRVPSMQAGTCAAGTPFSVAGLADQNAIDDAFKQSIANLKARNATCCAGGSYQTCDGAPDESATTPPPASAGIHPAQNAQADGLRATGKSLAYRVGYCSADKDICNTMADRAKAANPNPPAGCVGNGGQPCTTANLRQVCASEITGDPAPLLTTANQNFTDANRIDPQGTQGPGGNGNGPGGKGGPGDTASKDSPTKSPSSKSTGGGGMNPMSMLGPILSQLAQQQQNQDPTDPQQPPALAETPCGPGIVNGGAPCPGTPATATSDSFNKANGTSNFQTASSKAAGFNPGDTNPTAGTGNRGIAPVDPSQQQPLGTTQVPNGGGQMPGGGGGAQASLGGGGGGGAVPMGNTKLPDVGLTSHSGYSAQNAAMSTVAGGSGGFSGYGKSGEGELPFNYADWLPKGKNDPTRALAGGNMRPMQIQSKEVNIWNRISDHIKSRCSLGLLRDCVP